MARRYWTGGSNDGNLATSGNYDTFPVSGDSLVIGAASLSITLGASALAAIPLSAFEINEGHRGTQFGTAATPLQINAESVRIATETLGLISIKGASNFTDVHIAALGAGANVYIGGGTPTISTLHLGGGPGLVNVAESVKVNTLRTGGIGATLAPCTTSAPDIVYRIGHGAVVNSERKMARGVVDGRLNMKGAGSITHSTSGNTECIVNADAVLNFAATGAFTSAEILPRGTLSYKGAAKNVSPTRLYRYFGSNVQEPAGIDAEPVDTTTIGGGGNPAQ